MERVTLPDSTAMKLRTLTNGAFFGHELLIGEEAYEVTVIAREKTEVQALSQAQITVLKRENPTLALALTEHVLKIVSERLARNIRTMNDFLGMSR